MSDDEWKLVKKLQEYELRDLRSPYRLTGKRREIRVQSWQKLMEAA